MSKFAQDTSKAESYATNLLLLTWIAGMLDGLSYLRGHVFTANMTGNIVLLGIHLVQKDFPDAARSLLALFAFAIGCIIAGLLILEREDPGRSVMRMGFSAELLGPRRPHRHRGYGTRRPERCGSAPESFGGGHDVHYRNDHRRHAGSSPATAETTRT